MSADPVIGLLRQRADVMASLETCGEEEDLACMELLQEIDAEITQHKSASPMGKALSLAFLEYEIRELLDAAPDAQRDVIAAYLAILRDGLPEIPADIKAVLGQV